jgi:REP element-mobilizing transposase RayT
MLAAHVIFGAHGFWLPNDPRGSWSKFVGSWELFRYGPATKTTATRSVAAHPHNQAARLAAKRALSRPAVQFTGVQARAVARGFARYARQSNLAIFACAILPDHVHLVLGAHRLSPKQLVIQLKGAATEQLLEEQRHPFAHLAQQNGRPPKCFARGGWNVYLDKPDDVLRAIRYVDDNPQKEGKPRQRWSFITPFDQ